MASASNLILLSISFYFHFSVYMIPGQVDGFGSDWLAGLVGLSLNLGDGSFWNHGSG